MIDNLKYRTLQATDISENNYITKIVTQVNKFEDYWAKFNAGVDKVKSWFSGVPSVSGAVKQLKATPLFKNFLARHDYLSIGNASNNKIQLQVIETNGEKTIKATANGITQNTNFTFDVTYKHPELGNTVKKTINAVYTADSLSLLDKLIQWGPWKHPSQYGEEVFTFSATTFTYNYYDENGVAHESVYCLQLLGNMLSCDGELIIEILSISPSLLKWKNSEGDIYESYP